MPTTDATTTKGDASLASNAEKAAFDKALRAQITMNEELAKARAKNTKMRKGFKADGLILGKLDATIAMLEWSPSEIRESFAVAQRYAGYAGLPLGTQVDLLANSNEEEVARADWKARGRSDALRLKPAAVPKGCAPEFHQDYLAGHEEARWPK
jgi:hypothetical protein